MSKDISHDKKGLIDALVHRWLRVPYHLHASVRKSTGRARATIVFLHGIGNSGEAWNEVVSQLPDNIRIITIDLLGFGNSPRPSWVTYNATTQARAVASTCMTLGIRGKVIVVGHSMGALVAIELAKRYSFFIKSLVLCSPPLYKPDTLRYGIFPSTDKMLKDLYRSIHRSPEQFVGLSKVAMKYELINKAFNVTDTNVASYMAALEAAIINQTSLDDIAKLTLPIEIIRGTLDPVLVPGNIKKLAAAHSTITLHSVVAGHEVLGRFAKKTVQVILKAVQ